MDVTEVLITDPRSPWATSSDIIVLPAWPTNSKSLIDGKNMYPLDALREKKVRAVISFHEIAEGERKGSEFGSRDLILSPRFFIDVWSYNDLVLQRIADQIDTYYTGAVSVGGLDIVRFSSNGKMPSDDFCRKQFLLQVRYERSVL